MGRFRPLVAAIVAHTNAIGRQRGVMMHIGKGIYLNALEWQILEYIVEHKDETFSMVNMSDSLQIAQSSFSKLVKVLSEQGLVAKYHTEGNRKNVILRPTELALELYPQYAKVLYEKGFERFFAKLADLDDATLAIFAEAINALNMDLSTEESSKPAEKLIKIE